jgi:hypothetical protein
MPTLRKAAVATGGVQQPVQSNVPMETDSSALVSDGAAKISKKKRIKSFASGVARMATWQMHARLFCVYIVSVLLMLQRIATFSICLNLLLLCMVFVEMN